MITVKVEHRCTGQKNLDHTHIATESLFIYDTYDYLEYDGENPRSLIYKPYVKSGILPYVTMSGDFTPNTGVLYDTNSDEDYNIVINVNYDGYTPPPSSGGGSGGSNPDTPTNPSTPSGGYTLTISYFKEESSEPYSVNSYTHYGAWVADPGGYMIMYYDYEGSKDPTDVTRSGGPLGYILERFETNISSNSDSPSYGDVYMNYYYIKPPTITVEINDATRGTTDPSPGNHIADGANIGGSFIVDAIPYEGYMLDYWSVDGNKITNSNSRYVHTVDGDATIKAWFKVDSSSSGTTTPDYSGVAENKIATNKDILNILDIYSGYTGSETNKCPTKTQIINRAGSALAIPSSYSDGQCVKYSDITYGSKDCKVFLIITSGDNRDFNSFNIKRGDSNIKSLGAFHIESKSSSFGGKKYTNKPIDIVKHTGKTANFTAVTNSDNKTIQFYFGKFSGTCEAVYCKLDTEDNINNIGDLSKYFTNSLGSLKAQNYGTFDSGISWNQWLKEKNKQIVLYLDFRNNK